LLNDNIVFKVYGFPDVEKKEDSKKAKKKTGNN